MIRLSLYTEDDYDGVVKVDDLTIQKSRILRCD